MGNLSLVLRRLLFFILLTSGFNSFASHIVGIDLFYTYISGDTYQITLVAYGDCAGSAFSSLPTGAPVVCVYNGNTSVGSVTLAIQAPTNGVEITPVCPADASLTQCTSLSYTIPGIKKFVYTGTYTLPSASSTWRFIFTGDMGSSSAGRGTTITNISAGTIVQLVDTLDNSVAHNSNAQLTVLPTPFFCLDQPNYYNPGAADPDGDSLTFALVPGMNGNGNCSAIGGAITYTFPYTATAPLSTSSFSFSSSTGQINFNPNITQRSLVVYNIEEYRHPANYLIGTCQREMTFTVLTCTDVPPTGGFSGASTGTVVDSTSLDVCANAGAFSVHINATEEDTSNTINVTASGLPTGATFTTLNNGTNHAQSTFSWNTTGVAVGTYTFYVTFEDNACPLAGIKTEAYTVTILPIPTVTAATFADICPGASATLTASGAVSYSWAPSTGLSCVPCATTTATPPATTQYTVTGTATNGCTNTDTATVAVKPAPSISAGAPTAICAGSSTTLSATGGVSYTWAPATALSCTTCTNPVADPASTTVYSLTGVGVNGCTANSTVEVTVNPLPAISVAAAGMCMGSSLTLSPSGGVSYTWAPATGLSCTACTNPVCTVTITTTYTVTGTDVNGCVNHSPVTVTISAVPLAPIAVSPVDYCQNATASPLTATGTALLWYTAAVGGVGSATDPTPLTTAVGSVTYYVSQTVGGCESLRTPITVVVNALPVITVSPLLPVICAGSNTVLTASGGVSYTWAAAVGLSATTGASITASPATTTTYTVTGTGGDGCPGTATVTVTVNPLPSITVTPSSAVICSEGSATLSASGAASYIWAPASTLTSSIGATVTATPTVTVTYTVTGTDANSCVNTSTATVSVNPVPGAPAVISPIAYCLDASASALTATGTSLLWYTTATGGVGSSTAIVPVTTVLDTITYYVSQTVGGCEGPRDSISVDIKPLPVISIAPSSATICAGKDTTLSASGGVSYSWLPVTGLTGVTSGTVTAHPTTTTTYTVTGTGTDGCTDTASQLVTVNPLPVITVTPASPTICDGSSTPLDASGAVTYTWARATGLSGTTGTIVTAGPTVTTTYTVTGVDGNNCVNSATVVVTVNPIPPAPAVVSPVNYCMNIAATALTATGTGLLWYTASTGGVGSAIAPVPSTAAVGTTTWYVSQTVGGCEGPRSAINVVILPLPVVTCTPTTASICAGQTVDLGAGGALTYSWLPVAGLSVTVGAGITAAPAVTTVYSVTGADINHCTNIATATITVNPLPIIAIAPATPAVCIGSGIMLTASGAITFTWSPASTLSSSAGTSVEATPTNTTEYTITGTDGFGCVNSTSISVIVNPIPSPPTVVSPVTFCQDAPGIALSATGTDLLWYTTATGGTGSATAPVPPTTTLGSTEWYVSQTVNGCPSPLDSINVEVIRNAQTDFSYKIKYGCIIDTVSFTNTSEYAYRYEWFFGDDPLAAADSAANPVHYYTAVNSPTDFLVSLLGFSQYCYNDSTKKTVTLYPTPPISLTDVTPNQTLIYGDTLALNASGAQIYLWTPDNGTLSNPNINDPLAFPFENITYTVYGSDANGCEDSAKVDVTVIYEDNPIIPSAFTPNNDGRNDVFNILNLKFSKLVSFRIYNRWGQEVFSTTDVEKGWDGTFNGVPQGLDVYEYLIITALPNGENRVYKGDVTLIR